MKLEGFVDCVLPLPGYFVTKVTSVTKNGTALSEYALDRYFLVLAEAPKRSDVLVVTYTAGLTADTMPEAVSLATCLIAQALMANVGVGGIGTNVNYGAGGSDQPRPEPVLQIL